MARQGQWQIIPRHAAAIVCDTDQCFAPIGDIHRNAPRTGVYGVFDQFLDRGGGAFDHLARGNAVDCGVIQLTNLGAIFAYVGYC